MKQKRPRILKEKKNRPFGPVQSIEPLIVQGIQIGTVLVGFIQLISGNTESENAPIEDADFEIIQPKQLTNEKGK